MLNKFAFTMYPVLDIIGFTFEGIFRQNYIFKGRNCDTAWFSIINGEWLALKEKCKK